MILLVRIALRWGTAFYLALLLLLMLVLHWRGESTWILSLLLFLPEPVLLAPMLVLAPLCLLFGLWRMLALQAACAALLFFGYMTYGWGSASPAGTADLTLVTHNIGESNRPEVLAFLQEQKPDVVLLEDAHMRGPDFVRVHPEWHLAAEGQFVCLTRLPVLSSRLVTLPGWTGPAVAARFELKVKGQPAAFYAVHMPTPRPQFKRFLGRRPLSGLIGYRSFVAERVQLAQALSTVLAAEKEPLLVAGDFNMPDHGYAYHRYRAIFTDDFAKAGHAWGFTFPGSAHNPVTRGPWLRLDYIWSGRGWTPLSCATSTGRLSQHRAVVARFSFTP